MNCPDCGGVMTAASAIGFDYSYRCQRCNGWWVANWVVNNIADGRVVTADAGRSGGMVSGGENLCPTDKSTLTTVAVESVPESVGARKCPHCSWWWIPRNGIFELSVALSVKKQYLKWWDSKQWTAYAWPALVLVMMVTGLVGSVTLVGNSQRTSVNADFGVREFVVVPLGNGKVQVAFKADKKITEVKYGKQGGVEMFVVPVDYKSGLYSVILNGLGTGKYALKIGIEDYVFEVK